jgi:AmiR/NasT family two-component response regulator
MGTPNPLEPVRATRERHRPVTEPVDRDQLAAELEAAHAKIANLELALIHARRIGQAVGILMAQHRITEAEAFERLREASQQTHRKLHDIADDVGLTGEIPGP